MSKEDIDKAIKEAEKFAEEDKKAKELAETRNHAESLAFQCEKSLNDLGDKATDEEKQPVKDAIEKLKETAKGDNVDAMKADMEALEKSFYPIAQKLYAQNPNGDPNGDPNGGNGGFGGDDFEEKTDN